MTSHGANAEHATWLRRLPQMVVDFWRRPILAEPLAMCRIVTALTVLVGSLAGIAPVLQE